MKESHIRDEVLEHQWEGAGTHEDPFLVEFLPGDSENPKNFSETRKWFYAITVTISVFVVTFLSSAYSGTVDELRAEFGSSTEVILAGIALFVLGFALGPCFWAPLSEIYGRRVMFYTTFGCLTATTAGVAGSNSMTTLIVLRFLSGTFAASPLTNAGGVIADVFPPRQRGLGMTIFSMAPFLGPALGPVYAGFTSEAIGWRWVQGILAITTGVIWIFGTIVLPETYAPVLLQRRAKALSKRFNKTFISLLDKEHRHTRAQAIKTSLARPWILLFAEPIVLVASIYLSILYGTLYMLFGAYPIIYQQERGWSEGIGGLAFLGVTVGMIIGLAYMLYDNRRYMRLLDTLPENGVPVPEWRLPPTIIGSIALPIGLFWFAWTNGPSVHWSVSIIGSAPFAFGCVLVFVSVLTYLVDTYTIYAASVLAATAMLRSFFGTAFPLFVSQMYANLGIHWASSIPGFLTLLCLPFPPIMYFWGAELRMKCKYAAQAAAKMAQMSGAKTAPSAIEGETGDESSVIQLPDMEK
ncbi:MFS general substrate transporter [Mollisia scopiformis]|uniref:MFS general substrate transporter n=1 Tax=Mollisia scopiformis TaxID=149040 RepID=A0A194XNN1_MOLSC|nr:MFS general substrate transporter [Mollisia scopiformis]KUJ21337.1 MFS general substrate transporter [Mollisia scopiformis]